MLLSQVEKSGKASQRRYHLNWVLKNVGKFARWTPSEGRANE